MGQGDNVNRLINILTLLFLLTALSACGDKSETLIKDINSKKVEEAISKMDEIQTSIAEGQLLGRTSRNDKRKINETLKQLKINLMALDLNPLDHKALERIVRHLRFFETKILSERDIPRLNALVDIVRQEASRYAGLQGTSLAQVPWPLYNYGFSRGIEPFGVYSDGNNWERRYSQDRSSANVRNGGRDGESWLLTPTFNLAGVDNPILSIKHLLMIDDNNRSRVPLNMGKILSDAFKVMVTTNFKEGPQSLDNNLWEELTLDRLPSGRDFHSLTSSVSLKKYRGHNVTIAFILKTNTKEIGNHFLTWQIERLRILGAADKMTYSPRQKPFNPDDEDDLGKEVLHWSFREKGMGNLQQTALSGTPGAFSYNEGRGCAIISPNREKLFGKQLLYTGILDLTVVKEAAMRVHQTINFYTEEAKKHDLISIKIAEVVEGVEVSDLNWLEIPFKRTPDGSGWNSMKSEWVKLPTALQGKKVRLGFFYESLKQTSDDGKVTDFFPAWQIYDFWVNDLTGVEL